MLHTLLIQQIRKTPLSSVKLGNQAYSSTFLHFGNSYGRTTYTLLKAHIHIIDGDDEIIWGLEKSGRYTPKEGYLVLAESRKYQILHTWCKHLYKQKAPPRSRLLMWCILRNKIPTGDNLMKHSYHGPHWCYLYNINGESASHLFLNFHEARKLWTLVIVVAPHLVTGKRTLSQKPRTYGTPQSYPTN